MLNPQCLLCLVCTKVSCHLFFTEYLTLQVRNHLPDHEYQSLLGNQVVSEITDLWTLISSSPGFPCVLTRASHSLASLGPDFLRAFPNGGKGGQWWQGSTCLAGSLSSPWDRPSHSHPSKVLKFYNYTSLNSEDLVLFQYQALLLTASTIVALSLSTTTWSPGENLFFEMFVKICTQWPGIFLVIFVRI